MKQLPIASCVPGLSWPLRQRHTAATEQRIARFRYLLANLLKGEMSLNDICRLLGFSNSGARKYARQLRDAGVIAVSRYEGCYGKQNGTPVFKLTEGSQACDEFIALLQQPSMRGGSVDTPQTTSEIEPGHRVHLISGDPNHAARVQHRAVARDPWVTAIFGDAPSPGVR